VGGRAVGWAGGRAGGQAGEQAGRQAGGQAGRLETGGLPALIGLYHLV